MTSSEPSDIPSDTPAAGPDRPGETVRAVRMMERLARILDVPVAAFFEEDGRALPEAALAQEAEEMRRAYLAITDPALRRRCRDRVLAASRGEDTEPYPPSGETG